LRNYQYFGTSEATSDGVLKMQSLDPGVDLPKKSSKISVTDSTMSGVSNPEPYEEPRKSKMSVASNRKTRQSYGAYTSLFARKLLPPLGFYREADKYTQLRSKFKDDDLKLEAIDEMWVDYQKYQVRKRFRWPPQLICKKFFWTTGYYADYQKTHRATKLRKPGEDSSDEEFFNTGGQYMVAGGEDDINVEEFERYRQAKKEGAGHGAENHSAKKRSTRFHLNDDGNANEAPHDSYLLDKRPTVSRLFAEDEQGKEKPKGKKKSKGRKSQEIEEVETIVEYTLIENPNKKKRKSEGKDKKKKNEDQKANLEEINFAALESGSTGGKKLVTRRKSISNTDRKTGAKTVDLEESTEIHHGATVKEKSKKKSRVTE